MKELKDYPNYQIDITGNIYSKNKIKATSITKKGYKIVNLSNNGVAKSFSVHRLVAIHFINNPDNLPQVNHIDGNKLNNHIDNLEWCTNQENILHAIKIGLNDYKRNTKGIQNGNSKLSLEQVNDIKSSKEKNIVLAEKYKVSAMLISLIKRGKRW